METENYFDNNRYVKELSPKDFDPNNARELVKKANGDARRDQCTMILFYAPWCPHCKHLVPKWESAAKTTGFCDYRAFNCEKYKDHVNKMNSSSSFVTGYPTIILYRDGRPYKRHEGENTKKQFMNLCMSSCSG